jgi:hypothetical protein
MDQSTRSRVTARLAAGMLATSLLAACGGGATPVPTPPPDPSALLATSLAATSKLSGPIDIALTLDGTLVQSGSPAMNISGSSIVATIDGAGQQGEVTLVLKGVQGTGDINADVRVTGGTAYLQAAPLGETWYSLPLAAAEGLVPSSVPAPSAIPSTDPAAMLAPFLKDPGVKVTSGGTQQLDGRDQDVVMVTITGSTVAAFVAQAAAMAGTGAVPLPSMPATMPDIPVTFWIDHQSSQLSKVSTTFAEGGSSLTVALTIKAHSGTVSIQVPPADKTQDATQLLQMVMSGAGGGLPFASPAP